jgi:hypothetical protein
MRRRHQPKELGLNKDVVITRRQERKRQRKEIKEKSQKTRKRRQLELSDFGIVTGYKNKTQSMSVLISLDKNTDIKEEHYQVQSQLSEEKKDLVVNITMAIPYLKAVDQFWNWLLIGKLPKNIMPLFPNIKEISESMAAYIAMKPYLDKVDTVLVVGDGCQPRTGSILACLYPQLTIHSIDPMLKLEFQLANLKLYPMTIEKFLSSKENILSNVKGLCVICVHSHACFDDYMSNLFSLLPLNTFIAIYAMKCCRIYQSFTNDELEKYRLQLVKEDFDFSAQTPDRKFIIWTSKN